MISTDTPVVVEAAAHGAVVHPPAEAEAHGAVAHRPAEVQEEDGD